MTNFDFRMSATVAEKSEKLNWIDLGSTVGLMCGISIDQDAYCWGNNKYGQLGIGSTTDQTNPSLVAGGLKWSKISVGDFQICGIATNNNTYCWGTLGAFTALVPTSIASGKTLTQISSGNGETCGVDTANSGFCWQPFFPAYSVFT